MTNQRPSAIAKLNYNLLKMDSKEFESSPIEIKQATINEITLKTRSRPTNVSKNDFNFTPLDKPQTKQSDTKLRNHLQQSHKGFELLKMRNYKEAPEPAAFMMTMTPGPNKTFLEKEITSQEHRQKLPRFVQYKNSTPNSYLDSKRQS